MKQALPILLLLIAATITPGSATLHAKTRYVSDDFSVTVRTDPSSNARGIQQIRTGEKLTILERGKRGWSHVRLSDGREGWVVRRYLSDKPPAKIRMAEIEDNAAKFDSRLDALRKQVRSLKGQLVDQGKMQDELNHIRSVSREALALKEERDHLSSRVEKLEVQRDNALEERRSLERNKDTLFFSAGAGVLVLGMIVGGILSRRNRSSRSGLGTLR